MIEEVDIEVEEEEEGACQGKTLIFFFFSPNSFLIINIIPCFLDIIIEIIIKIKTPITITTTAMTVTTIKIQVINELKIGKTSQKILNPEMYFSFVLCVCVHIF
mgnify:CR=1 FL=1